VDASSDVSAPGNSIVQRSYSKSRFHPGIDGIPHDSIAKNVLDRAQVELAFSRLMLGNIGQPEPVRCVSDKLALNEVIVCQGTLRIAHLSDMMTARWIGLWFFLDKAACLLIGC